MKRISAFTLIEVVVAMLLGSIVVAFAVLAFQLVSKQVMVFKNASEGINEVYIFHYLLKNDVSNAEILIHESSGIKFIFEDNKKIKYILSDDNIIRDNSERQDTFFFSDADIEASLVSDIQESGEEVIKSFVLEFNIGNDTIITEFYKKYSVATMLKYKLKNE